MRPQKIDDRDLLTGLKSVLTAKGYDGAKLNELAASSGLQKASLYHRYPGGKKEIALAVLNFIGQWVNKHIIQLLHSSEIIPTERLEEALTKISELYNDGKSTCILRALSLDGGMEMFNEEIGNSARSWVHAFEKLGLDFGFDSETALQYAYRVLTTLQGSLVVSKMLDDTNVFKSGLSQIREMYLSQIDNDESIS